MTAFVIRPHARERLAFASAEWPTLARCGLTRFRAHFKAAIDSGQYTHVLIGCCADDRLALRTAYIDGMNRPGIVGGPNS